MYHYLVESMPIAAVYVCITLFILASSEAGFLTGRYHHLRNQDATAPTSVGPMVGGLLGMLAFVLAFTFSTASGQYTERKHDVLDEANLIGTAYLRTDLLPAQQGDEAKRLLRDYVAARLQASRDGNWQLALKRSEEIHASLWTLVLSAAKENPGALSAMVVESVNAVIDMNAKRLNDAVRARIPGSIWFGLMMITMLTMGTLGLQLGFAGKRRMLGIIPIAMSFAVLATLIVDLNRPQGGFIKVGQQAMLDLQATINPGAR